MEAEEYDFLNEKPNWKRIGWVVGILVFLGVIFGPDLKRYNSQEYLQDRSLLACEGPWLSDSDLFEGYQLSGRSIYYDGEKVGVVILCTGVDVYIYCTIEGKKGFSVYCIK